MGFASITSRLKRVLNQLNVWLLRLHLNRHDIEATELVCLLLLHEVRLRCLYQVALFLKCDSRRWRTILLRAPCFHLNEGQHAAITCNKIDLPKPTAIISFQNSVAMLTQVLNGSLFSCFADCLSRFSHTASPSAPHPERSHDALPSDPTVEWPANGLPCRNLYVALAHNPEIDSQAIPCSGPG